MLFGSRGLGNLRGSVLTDLWNPRFDADFGGWFAAAYFRSGHRCTRTSQLAFVNLLQPVESDLCQNASKASWNQQSWVACGIDQRA